MSPRPPAEPPRPPTPQPCRFVDDARWISKISGHSRILPLKNAWFALSVAGYWRRSVELAADFLHPDHHLDHIAIEKDGDRPILKDEDSWPALAAILAYEDVDGLGPARKRLRPDVVAHPRFGIAVEVMKPLILKDAPYSAVLEAMKEVMK